MVRASVFMPLVAVALMAEQFYGLFTALPGEYLRYGLLVHVESLVEKGFKLPSVLIEAVIKAFAAN